MYRRNAADGRISLESACPHLLLVEGVEDCRFYEVICQFAGVSEKIQIWSAGGKDFSSDKIKALVTVGSHLRTIAIIRDAEDNHETTWLSATGSLQRAKLPSPPQPGILSSEIEGKCTAVLIVPYDRPGSIESVCWASLKGPLVKHPLVACVEQFLDCAQASNPPPHQPTQATLDKMRLWSLLAVGATNPRTIRAGLRLAEAAEKDFWDWTHEAFSPIIDFVKTVARM
jgi:Protein of unknown function (DUF3226)